MIWRFIRKNYKLLLLAGIIYFSFLQRFNPVSAALDIITDRPYIFGGGMMNPSTKVLDSLAIPYGCRVYLFGCTGNPYNRWAFRSYNAMVGSYLEWRNGEGWEGIYWGQARAIWQESFRRNMAAQRDQPPPLPRYLKQR